LGRERKRGGKFLYFCLAILIAGCLTGCAPLRELETTWRRSAHLKQMQDLTQKGEFELALRENQQILDRFPDAPPGDAALFSMALISADKNYSRRNYEETLAFFAELADRFPQSPFAQQASIWLPLLEREVSDSWKRSAHLERMRNLTQKGEFEPALRENQQVLDRFPDAPPGDAALFSMALISADKNYSRRNYEETLAFFAELADRFPQSPFAQQASIWLPLLEREVSDSWKRSAHLERMRNLTQKGEFEPALRENQQVLDRFPDAPPGDAALFSMGWLHVHFANPKKNFRSAMDLFSRLRREFPDSPFHQEAQTWMSILDRMEQAARVDIEIEERKKMLHE